MVSHIVGGAIGITATVLCVVFAAVHGNVYGIVSGAIFGATMIVLYTMSSIYHGLRPNTAKKVFHCGNLHTVCALHAEREQNMARLDCFRSYLGACRSRNNAERNRP